MVLLVNSPSESGSQFLIYCYTQRAGDIPKAHNSHGWQLVTLKLRIETK